MPDVPVIPETMLPALSPLRIFRMFQSLASCPGTTDTLAGGFWPAYPILAVWVIIWEQETGAAAGH